jgi:hypothetical protein
MKAQLPISRPYYWFFGLVLSFSSIGLSIAVFGLRW